MIAHKKLTLRTAFEQHFRTPAHAERTVETYREAIDRWEETRVSIPAEPGQPLRRKKVRNPDVRAIDAQTLVDFKNAHLTLDRSSSTLRKWLRHVLAILNHLGPKTNRNPEALGILPHVPVVKKPPERRRPPRIAESSELDRLVEACRVASWPRCEIDPVEWWRSLIVFLYNVGLRRLDWIAVRRTQVDLERGAFTFAAHKTDKPKTLPLHSVVISRLQAIWLPERAMLWPWRFEQAGADPIDRFKTSLYRTWKRIQAEAGIAAERKIDLHDLRRTCGSEIFWQNPAAAQELLQHSSIVTTQRAYADVASPITRELMLAKRQPLKFAPSNPTPPDPPANGPPEEPRILRFPGRAG